MVKVENNSLKKDDSFLDVSSLAFIETLFKKYLEDPSCIDRSWLDYFNSINFKKEHTSEQFKKPSWKRSDWPLTPIEHLKDLDEAVPTKKSNSQSKSSLSTPSDHDNEQKVTDSIRALMLIRAYRIRGHLAADLDPLKINVKLDSPELDPKNFGFTDKDLDRSIFLDDVLGLKFATLREIIEIVKRTYCGTFALQYMHISDPDQSSWLKERIEGLGKEIQFTQEGRKAILNKLVEAEGLEKFLHIKYMGTKRFGLDGGEALIPAMEQIIKRGGNLGVKEIVIGMPHRGRLSVLANVMGKPFKAIFNEFQGGSYKPDEVEGSGDVKYHLGASSDREFDGNKVHLSLTANPSHLEAVNPVVLGKVRAKQEQLNDDSRKQVLPILLHGDAAFAGQGVVAECFGLSGLKGHKTGGTIHIIVNNQIGFTTSPSNSRSSPYPTDIALMVEAPIFHVNGDDPEAVVHAAKVATEFRQKFRKDVVIDIFCYRRFGHNEGDEPMFTQPNMYAKIKSQPTALQKYTKRLIEDGLLPEGEIDQIKTKFQSFLSQEFEASKSYKPNKADWLDGKWSGVKSREQLYQRGKTSLSEKQYNEIGLALTKVPVDFKIHRTVSRMLEQKKKSISTGKNIDWATGEALAFGSLLLEGFPVRLSGQDCTRGTFSQRHCAFIDQNTEERYYPLNNIQSSQNELEVIDSMLSEYAVLGYEYGYSLAEPNALCIWEAQFGDFANGAQIMFDQFISSGERKWLRMSGLTVLLPHGFEGQGPEHSSARLERFLQMSAEDNWIIANCTTPANYFHVLRRQLHRKLRKPLIIMTPKSLLRHKKAVSKKEDFINNTSFHRILWDDGMEDGDISLLKDENISRVILCSGKIYYDILEKRNLEKLADIYILRIEQLYPFPEKSLVSELKRFPNAEYIWCQEEPENQGAWTFISPLITGKLNEISKKNMVLKYAGRQPSASPATGLAEQHKKEQEKLINNALGI